MDESSAASPARTGHAGAVALRYADEVLVRCVRDVHRAVLRRTFALLPTGVPIVPAVATIQTAVTEGVYAAVSGGLRAGAYAAGHAPGGSVEQSPRSRLLRSAVNAYMGDRLTDRGDAYALRMTVRSADADLELTPEGLAQAFPAARDTVVVLVHGLGENDETWSLHAERRGSTYAEDIGRGDVATPVLVRYNTGRHVSDNGADLSALLGELVAAWPTPPRRIHLVGHSMGGLVIRSAAAQGSSSTAPWVDRVATIVSLGTPHHGAPLEQAVHLGSRALRVTGPSRPFADLLDSRSSGIVDLRHGHTSESDWHGKDLAREWGAEVAPLAPLRHVQHHFVAAQALGAPDTRLSQWVGDLMVPAASASGGGARRPVVATATVHRVRGTHQGLLNLPEVATLLQEWLR